MKIFKSYILFFVFSVIFLLFAVNLSKNQKNFIYVVPKIKNFEVLRSNIGSYSIKPLNTDINPSIKQINFLNGTIFYNVPNGTYLIKGFYLNDRDEIQLTKEKDWEKIYLNLEGTNFSQRKEYTLLFLTLSLVLLNLFFYFSIKMKFPKKTLLHPLFVLLVGKIILSLRLAPTNNYLTFLDFLITRILLFGIVLYFLKHIFPKQLENLKKIIYLILILIYSYNLVIGLSLFSPQFLVYLLEFQPNFLRIVSVLRKSIDLTRVLFILFGITFLYYKPKYTLKSILNWGIVWSVFIICEFFREIFPKAENLGYFIDLIEIFSIFWTLVFYSFKIYNKNVLRAIIYTISITLSYISLFYFKTILEPLIIIVSTVIFDISSAVINSIMEVKNPTIDFIYNRLCLIENIDEFEKNLEKELLKAFSLNNVFVKILLHKKELSKYIEEENFSSIVPKESLKLKNFDYAYRISFNKNKEVALIFIEEKELPLTLKDQNLLSILFDKLSPLINKLRLNHLYKELG